MLNRSNLANTASLLWHAYQSLPFPSNEANWAGFYTISTLFSPQPDPKATHLILGPFAGRPACQTIILGRGICGTAAAQKHTVGVHDVDQFEGYSL